MWYKLHRYSHIQLHLHTHWHSNKHSQLYTDRYQNCTDGAAQMVLRLSTLASWTYNLPVQLVPRLSTAKPGLQSHSKPSSVFRQRPLAHSPRNTMHSLMSETFRKYMTSNCRIDVWNSQEVNDQQLQNWCLKHSGSEWPATVEVMSETFRKWTTSNWRSDVWNSQEVNDQQLQNWCLKQSGNEWPATAELMSETVRKWTTSNWRSDVWNSQEVNDQQL